MKKLLTCQDVRFENVNAFHLSNVIDNTYDEYFTKQEECEPNVHISEIDI